ncbi:MAG: selenide, water dikinase SelD [Salibacteraceae bacterium]
MEKRRLTEMSKGSGCGCKIAPADLRQILASSDWNDSDFDRLLIGNGANDDAAVYALDSEQCIISTTDFFTPIVDDPTDFGAVAACNALSDVYAMGGKPIMALGILGWPIEQLGAEMASHVIQGAKKICAQAKIPMAGGHSIDSKEPFFGLAVTGLVNRKDIKSNGGSKPGDTLYLTKPIGSGMAAAGLKRDLIEQKEFTEVLEVMLKLNDVGAALGRMAGVTAMTDVTGFGLLGHLIEMCEASKTSAQLDFSAIPTLSDNLLNTLTSKFVMPDNTMRNFKEYGPKCSKLSGTQLQLLCDPQSNGGLLISVDPENSNELESTLIQANLYAKPIGVIGEQSSQETIIQVD